MSTFSTFVKKAGEKAEDRSHLLKILKAVSTHDTKVEAMKTMQFRDWQSARQKAEQVKNYVLENLPELLESFEKNISARGAEVLWARDTAEAQKMFLEICRKHKAQNIIKSKSMTTEEIELNETIESTGRKVWESDLGELIVQLAGEKPYHIVTPAMHKNTAEIAELFHEKLGTPITDSAEELTMAARRYLRNAYVTADLGVTGANFLIADEGAVVLTENEGNARLTMSCPPVHVVIAGIEKVLPSISVLPLFLPLLATSGTGQQITCYNTLIRGPRWKNEPDGPENLYIILLDNGRTGLYNDTPFRQSLRCIRCGACLNACPVYRTIGGHTYQTTYQGPIGSVITPHLRPMKAWNHLSFASSLCAACTSVCPVRIDLHVLLLENRWEAYTGRNTGLLWRAGLKFWAYMFTGRKRLNFFRTIGRIKLPFIRPFLPNGLQRRIPPIPPKSFARLWGENEQQK
jgi:L-lactate dehydrogenase complex protein LldF